MKFWGLEVEEIRSDDYIFWRIFNLKKPFYHNGFYWAGINIKLLEEAFKKGVSRLYVWWEDFEDDVGIPLPTNERGMKRLLKEKEKEKEFEVIPSKFEGGEPMKIYWFVIGKYKGQEGIKPKTKREMNKEERQLNSGEELPIENAVEVKDLYEVKDTREVGGVKWCWIKWLGWYKGAEEYKVMMREIFGDLREDCEFSYETKRLYVKESALEDFEKIIVKYAENFRSADEEVAKQLDDLFGRKREEAKAEDKKDK